MNFDKSDIRKLIYFFHLRGLNATEIAKEICQTLGEDVLTIRTAQRWVSNFKNNEFTTDDAERSGRPSTDNLNEQIEEYISTNKHATCTEMAEAIGVGKSTIWRHLIDMGKKYLAFQWVPHKLSEENKNNRVRISGELLSMYRRNNFLNQLVTVDEAWLYWENDRKTPGIHHKSWRGSGDEPPQVTRRSSMTVKKQLGIFFWDCKGIILFETLPRNVSITAELYCQFLDKLKVALHDNRRRTVSSDSTNLFLLQDNARPHTAIATQEKLRELHINPIPHPPYSPDLSPSDFYLFSALKASFKDKNFTNDDELITHVTEWSSNKDQEFYRKAFMELPSRWQRCIDAEGNYFNRLSDNDN